MSVEKRLTRIFKNAPVIEFDNNSKFVIISDCHRGDGSWADNFAKNANVYLAALRRYYERDFTYIELGDGDELWGNKYPDKIVVAHSSVFAMLSQFYSSGRMIMLYGNHDMCKKHKNCIRKGFCNMGEGEKIYERKLFCEMDSLEGIVLKHEESEEEILLIHGHQADFLNYSLWRLNCFFVRHIWKPLELLGIKDPTSASDNYSIKNNIEKKLINWAKKEDKTIFSGHTHRTAFPKKGEPRYFNDGSCIQPWGITAIEIENGQITLVKWSVQTRCDGVMCVGKEVLEGPAPVG